MKVLFVFILLFVAAFFATHSVFGYNFSPPQVTTAQSIH
jgi:hypothetical protein